MPGKVDPEEVVGPGDPAEPGQFCFDVVAGGTQVFFGRAVVEQDGGIALGLEDLLEGQDVADAEAEVRNGAVDVVVHADQQRPSVADGAGRRGGGG